VLALASGIAAAPASGLVKHISELGAAGGGRRPDVQFFLGSLCPGNTPGRAPQFGFEALMSGPDKATYYGAAIREKRRKTTIYRAAGGTAKPSAFEYDNALAAATIALPEPFSGTATFQRGAGGANSWLGDLAVDLPGHPGLALAGSAFKAKLSPAEYHSR
jgi:hypothetical protein